MEKRQRNTFLTPLVVEVMPSGKQFKLHHEFTYKTWTGAKVIVPIGFETDFASIPRFARVIIPKLGKYTKAAVVHDYLYQKRLFFHADITWKATRPVADHIFREAMKDLGVVKWKRTLMYWAVRSFGWLAWRNRK